MSALVAAAVGLLAACSGDDYEGLSKEEFVAAANGVCTVYEQRTNSVNQTVSADEPERSARTIREEFVPLMRAQVTELRSLKPPEDDRERVEDMLDAVDAGTDQVEERATEAPRSLFAEDFEPYAAANEAAREYGLTACAG